MTIEIGLECLLSMEGPPGLAVRADISAAITPKGSVCDQLGHLVGADAKDAQCLLAVDPLSLLLLIEALQDSIKLRVQAADRKKEGVFQSICTLRH